MDLDWVGASRQEHGGQFHIVADGGPPPPYPIGYPMFYGVEERKEATRGETLYAPRLEDSWGAWVVAMAPIRDSAGHVVGLVEVQQDALKAEAEAAEEKAFRESARYKTMEAIDIKDGL